MKNYFYIISLIFMVLVLIFATIKMNVLSWICLGLQILFLILQIREDKQFALQNKGNRS